MSAGSNELAEIINQVRSARCTSVDQVRNVLDGYFNQITWSLLKDEWVRLSEREKSELAIKVFNDTRGRS